MQKKALIVDNDFFFVEFLSELLEKRGYQILKAYDGKEGIAKLEAGPVDILFADLITQKVDGRQFFKYVRAKYDDKSLPIVALSGTMLEHMGSLNTIDADYFIAKGPIDALTIKLNSFMNELEKQTFQSPRDKRVLAADNVFPRRDAMELIKSLRFQQAVIECVGVGIITVDHDTRILHANQTALDLIGQGYADVINCRIADIFSDRDRIKLIEALKHAIHPREPNNVSFYTTLCSQMIGVVVSSFNVEGEDIGWIISLQTLLAGGNN